MPKHSRSTFGCITRMRPGVWRLRYPADTEDGRKRVSETVYGSRSDAEDRLAEIRVTRSRRGGVPSLDMVYEKMYVPYLELMLANQLIKPNSVTNYEHTYTLHIKPALGRMPVNKITAADVQDLIITLNKPTGSVVRSIVRAILDRAVFAGYVATNVADCRIMLSAGNASHDKTVYTLAQLTELDAALHGWVCESSYLLQAHAGMRVGESLAIRLSDVSFVLDVKGGKTAVINVEHTVMRDGTLAPTKTRECRQAYMTEPWSNRLEELVTAARKRGDTYLLDMGGGAPMTTNRTYVLWQDAPIPDDLPRIPMRNLRNSYETYMHWELNQPIEVTSKLLGHKRIATTEKHYDRPDGSMLLRAAAGSAEALPDYLK